MRAGARPDRRHCCRAVADALRAATRDADLVATLAETTAGPALERLRDAMLADPHGEGPRILRERPRISSRTADPARLRGLPDGTLGREYVRFLGAQRVTADSRRPVQFVDDAELAYVMQRHREVHDFWHVLLGLPLVSVTAELALKWWEAVHTGLPHCAMAAAIGPLSPSMSQAGRRALLTHYIPWAVRSGRTAHPLMAVYYEQHLDEPVVDLCARLRVERAPTC